MIGCDVQITPLDDDERALLARYAARKATAARTYATAQLPSLHKPQRTPAHRPRECARCGGAAVVRMVGDRIEADYCRQCFCLSAVPEVCGAPLRYARAARPLKLESTE